MAYTLLTFSASVIYRGRDKLRAITLSADPMSKAQGWPGPHASCHIPIPTCQSPCQGPESLWPFFMAMLFHWALLSETQCVRQQRKIKETHRHKSSPFTHTLLICYCILLTWIKDRIDFKGYFWPWLLYLNQIDQKKPSLFCVCVFAYGSACTVGYLLSPS